MRQLAAAKASLDLALVLRPDFADGILSQARIALLEGDGAAATALVDKALAIDPKNVDGWLLKGGIQRQAGTPDLARTSFLKAIEINPRSAAARLDLASLENRCQALRRGRQRTGGGARDRAQERDGGVPAGAARASHRQPTRPRWSRCIGRWKSRRSTFQHAPRAASRNWRSDTGGSGEIPEYGPRSQSAQRLRAQGARCLADAKEAVRAGDSDAGAGAGPRPGGLRSRAARIGRRSLHAERAVREGDPVFREGGGARPAERVGAHQPGNEPDGFRSDRSCDRGSRGGGGARSGRGASGHHAGDDEPEAQGIRSGAADHRQAREDAARQHTGHQHEGRGLCGQGRHRPRPARNSSARSRSTRRTSPPPRTLRNSILQAGNPQAARGRYESVLQKDKSADPGHARPRRAG